MGNDRSHYRRSHPRDALSREPCEGAEESDWGATIVGVLPPRARTRTHGDDPSLGMNGCAFVYRSVEEESRE